MTSGVVVQEYCDDILLNEITPGEAYRNAVAKIQGFEPLEWHDSEKENAIINHRTEPKYALKTYKDEPTYRKDADGEFCELELVYANRNTFKVFKPSEDELRVALDFLMEACSRRERLLKVASSTKELLRLCDPDWGHMFAWKDLHPEVLSEAKKIWR